MIHKLLFLIFTICLSACEWAGILQAQTSRTAYIDTLIIGGELEKARTAILEARKDNTFNADEKAYIQVRLLRVLMDVGDASEIANETKRAEKLLASYSGKYKNKYTYLYYIFHSHTLLRASNDTTKVFFFLKKAEELASQFPNEKDLLAILNSTFGKYYLNNGEYEKSLEYFNKSLAVNAKGTPYYALTLNNIGVVHDYLNDLPLALKYYKESTELREKILRPDHPHIADGYYNMAGIQTTLALFDDAKKSFEKSLAISQKAYKDDKLVIAELYNAMGELHYDLEEYDIAESLWLKSVKSYGESPYRALPLRNLALLYLNTHRIYYSKPSILESIKLNEQSNGAEHIVTLRAKHTLAMIYLYEQKTSEAAVILEDLIRICGKHGDSHVDMLAIALLDKAKLQLTQDAKALDKNLMYEALKINSEFFSPSCYAAVSCSGVLARYYQAIGDSENATNWSWQTLKKCTVKYRQGTWPLASETLFPELALQALFILSKQKGQPLKQVFKLGDEIISQTRQRMLVGTDKQLFSKTARDFYDQCFHKFAEQQNLEQAFLCAEKSKAMVLLEYQGAEKGWQSLPSNLSNKEKNILGKIGKLNSLLHRIPESDPVLRQQYQSELSSNLLELKNLRDEIRQKYPSYYTLKYEQPLVSVFEFGKQLPEDTDMLYFHFVGDELAVFHFAKGKPVSLSWRKEVPELSTLTTKLKKAIEEYDITTFNSVAYSLGKLLIMDNYPNAELPKRLMVVPDKFLWQIPFDLLLTKSSTSENTWRKLWYVALESAVSYQFGANAWLSQKEASQQSLGNNENTRFLGYACTYANKPLSTARSLAGQNLFLPNAEKEMRQIKNIFSNAETVIGAKVDKKALIDGISQADVLHLAMHAHIESLFPDYSKLLLSSDTANTNECLHLRELYFMPTRARLVTLSACNTGSGEFQDGEGVASLAKGFTQAGARSVAYTQWFLSDEASPRLMELFYENLKKDMGKDEALQKAKLTFLEECDGPLSAPVFWGSFAISGDIGQLPRENKVHTKKIFLGTLFTVLGLVALGTKRFW